MVCDKTYCEYIDRRRRNGPRRTNSQLCDGGSDTVRSRGPRSPTVRDCEGVDPDATPGGDRDCEGVDPDATPGGDRACEGVDPDATHDATPGGEASRSRPDLIRGGSSVLSLSPSTDVRHVATHTSAASKCGLGCVRVHRGP